MAFKMKPPYKKDNTPIYEVPFDNPNLVAKANKNGTIIVNKDLATCEDTMKEAMAHEKVHLKDMANGDLDYDAESVTYKGKKYDRGSFDEGDETLPWEAHAYKTGRSGKEVDVTPKKEKLTGPPAMKGDMGKSHEPREQDHDTVSMNEKFGTAMVKNWHGPSARDFSGATDEEASKITEPENESTTSNKRTIMQLNNAEIYKFEKKGFFDKHPASMKILMNTPKGKEYKIWSSYRDKENERIQVGELTDKAKNLTEDQLEHLNKPDRIKDYGENEEYKKIMQQAGKVYTDKGIDLYPGMKGYTEGLLKQKAEGYDGTSMEKTDRDEDYAKKKKAAELVFTTRLKESGLTLDEFKKTEEGAKLAKDVQSVESQYQGFGLYEGDSPATAKRPIKGYVYVRRSRR